MLGLQLDYNHSGFQHQRQGVCHLGGKPFLHLRASGGHFQCPAQFADSRYLTLRQVPHSGLSEKGQQVMLAHGVKAEAGHGHRIVCFRLKYSVNCVLDTGPHPGEERLIHPGHTSRRLLQTFTAGVLADTIQDVRYCPLNATVLDRDSLLLSPDSWCIL